MDGSIGGNCERGGGGGGEGQGDGDRKGRVRRLKGKTAKLRGEVRTEGPKRRRGGRETGKKTFALGICSLRLTSRGKKKSGGMGEKGQSKGGGKKDT